MASPRKPASWQNVATALGWTAIVLLTLFLLWQLLDGRIKIRPFSSSFALARVESLIAQAPPPDSSRRLLNDLSSDLWTAERLPEERFVVNDMIADLPAIHVPGDSTLAYNIDVPPGSRFRVGLIGKGEGAFRAAVNIGAESVYTDDILAAADLDAADIQWVEVDLSPWSGQPVLLALQTEANNDALEGWWVMPQIETKSEWLLTDTALQAADIETANYLFDDLLELQGFKMVPNSLKAGDPAQVTLYWRLVQETDAYAKVFVHLINEQGQLVAQDDGQPVNDTYPIPLWQPGAIIADEHTLQLPVDLATGTYALAVGLYDPTSLQRWNVKGQDGQIVRDGSALLTRDLEVSP
jgi:hypothetical protein